MVETDNAKACATDTFRAFPSRGTLLRMTKIAGKSVEPHQKTGKNFAAPKPVCRSYTNHGRVKDACGRHLCCSLQDCKKLPIWYAIHATNAYGHALMIQGMAFSLRATHKNAVDSVVRPIFDENILQIMFTGEQFSEMLLTSKQYGGIIRKETNRHGKRRAFNGKRTV